MTIVPIWKAVREKSTDRKWLRRVVSSSPASSPGKSADGMDLSDGGGGAIAALELDSVNEAELDA